MDWFSIFRFCHFLIFLFSILYFIFYLISSRIKWTRIWGEKLCGFCVGVKPRIVPDTKLASMTHPPSRFCHIVTPRNHWTFRDWGMDAHGTLRGRRCNPTESLGFSLVTFPSHTHPPGICTPLTGWEVDSFFLSRNTPGLCDANVTHSPPRILYGPDRVRGWNHTHLWR